MPHNARRDFARIAGGEPYILDLGRFIDENPLAIVPRAEIDLPVAGLDDREAAGREKRLDVLSVHSSPQRTIRNAELLKAQMLGTNQGL